MGSISGSGESAHEPPSLGPVPQRIEVETETVRMLVAEQFPQWADLPIEPVRNGGWDNRTFHLGEEMLVRLPSAAEYALAVEKEHRWLPELAPLLPRPIPSPRGYGVPGAGYPYAWSVYGWLEGHPASHQGLADPVRFAEDLADFLVALRAVDPTDGPQPGLHNWYRGGPLRTYDDTTRRSLAALQGHLDVGMAAEVWDAALAADWDGVDVWFHGDLAAGNLLLTSGELAAVIDFGTCGVGDPACDLAIAWTLLNEPGRQVFRDRLGVDDATWSRGRGWALWKTLAEYAGGVEDADEDEAAQPLRVLHEIFDE